MRVRFDRGTLVLEPEPGITGARDPSKIPGAAWDAERHAWRIPAERYRELRVQLADEQIRIPDMPAQSLGGTWTLPAARWYQTTAVARWKTAGRRGVVALPTGSGKTLVALTAIAELGVPALIVVPTCVLLDQWSVAIANVWSGKVGRIGDGNHDIQPITVCTYASAAIWASRIGDRFGVVVIDEAHHVGAWCSSEVLEMMVAPARLGLTATPPPPGGELAERIGPVVYSLGVADLTGDALAEYELVSVPIALAKPERERYRTQRSRFANVYAKLARRERGQMDWRRFVDQATRTADGREALDAWKGYRSLIAYAEGKRVAVRELLAKHRGERTLVFTADVATAYQIARELLIMPITHEIGRAERTEVIEKFRTGEITVLVSAHVLDEGFDVPDADVAIIVGGSSSARRQVQRIGRVLRPREGKKAMIYELAVLETTEIDDVRRRHGKTEPGDAVAQQPARSVAREPSVGSPKVSHRGLAGSPMEGAATESSMETPVRMPILVRRSSGSPTGSGSTEPVAGEASQPITRTLADPVKGATGSPSRRRLISILTRSSLFTGGAR